MNILAAPTDYRLDTVLAYCDALYASCRKDPAYAAALPSALRHWQAGAGPDRNEPFRRRARWHALIVKRVLRLLVEEA